MATVTGVLENRGIVEIQADRSTIARVRKAHFDKCPVVPGEEIDVDAYLERLAAVQYPDAYEAALTALDHSSRSGQELANALRRKGYVEPAVRSVLARLTESGLIDDARYALRMAETQSARPVGLYAFKRKLRAKGISEEDADEALGAFDDAQQRSAALETANRLARKYASLPRREARAKLSQALARRGFPWDAIDSAIDEVFDD